MEEGGEPEVEEVRRVFDLRSSVVRAQDSFDIVVGLALGVWVRVSTRKRRLREMLREMFKRAITECWL